MKISHLPYKTGSLRHLMCTLKSHTAIVCENVMTTQMSERSIKYYTETVRGAESYPYIQEIPQNQSDNFAKIL